MKNTNHPIEVQHNYRLAPEQKRFMKMVSDKTGIKLNKIGENQVRIFAGNPNREDLKTFKKLKEAGKTLSTELIC